MAGARQRLRDRHRAACDAERRAARSATGTPASAPTACCCSSRPTSRASSPGCGSSTPTALRPSCRATAPARRSSTCTAAGWTDSAQFSIQTIAGEIRPTILDERTLPGRHGPRERGGRRSRSPGIAARKCAIGNPQFAVRVGFGRRARCARPGDRSGPPIEHDPRFPNRTNVSFWTELGTWRDPRADLRARRGGDAQLRHRRDRRRRGLRPARRRLARSRCSSTAASWWSTSARTCTSTSPAGRIPVFAGEVLEAMTGVRERLRTRAGHRRRRRRAACSTSSTRSRYWAPIPQGRRSKDPSDDLRGVRLEPVTTVVDDLDAPPADAPDAYLRLHLLSHRLVAPARAEPRRHLRRAAQRRVDEPRADATSSSVADAQARRAHGIEVRSVDKFPRMTDYVVPPGVRIADADRVRLGAHLADGTTVMHEGFVNYNAGTLGASMVEGRISAGRGRRRRHATSAAAPRSWARCRAAASEVISDRRAVSARARTPASGISLGDDCVVEAGLYITAGTRVTLPDGEVVKAPRAVGRVERSCSAATARPVRSRWPSAAASWGGLNAALHVND